MRGVWSWVNISNLRVGEATGLIDRNCLQHSLTGAEWLKEYAREMQAAGNLMMLFGVDQELMAILEKESLVALLGQENVFLAEPELMASTENALGAAERWLEDRAAESQEGIEGGEI